MLAASCQVELAKSLDETRNLSGQTVNISLNGVQFICDEAVQRAIASQDDFPLKIYLTIQLPGPVGAISSSARVVVTRRMARDRFNLGCEFVDMDEGNRAALERYLREYANPA